MIQGMPGYAPPPAQGASQPANPRARYAQTPPMPGMPTNAPAPTPGGLPATGMVNAPMPTAPTTATPPANGGAAQPWHSSYPLPGDTHGSLPGAFGMRSPTDVTIDPHLLDANGQFGQYQDASYQNALRTLQPQIQQQRAQFDQDMAARGFAPGSEAYQSAYDNMTRSSNDLLSQAAFGAQGAGLSAQNQAFGQGLSQAQLANQLATARINSQASNASARANAEASRHNSDNDYNLGLQRLGLDSSNSDFSNLMGLANLGLSGTQQRNGAQQLDYGRNQGILSQYNQNGPVPIDVLGNYNAYGNNQQQRANQQDSRDQGYAQWAAALASMFG